MKPYRPEIEYHARYIKHANTLKKQHGVGFRGLILSFHTKTKELGKSIFLNWKKEWLNKTFRMYLITTILLFPVVLFSTHCLFNYIQDCKGGIVLNDWVLKEIPPRDVSVPITFLMTSVILLCILRFIPKPKVFVTAFIAFNFLLVTRIITISATRLIAPTGLIELKDPIGNILYGARFINRDLFYSGHTATLFTLYLCSFKKTDKYYILFAVISVGILLLVQHVHYTVDVVSAPFFAFGCFWSSKKITNLSSVNRNSHL
jgi:hypothetical protein